MVGQVQYSTITVIQIAYPAILATLQPIIILGSVRIAMIRMVGEMLTSTMMASRIVYPVMSRIDPLNMILDNVPTAITPRAGVIVPKGLL
jgi:hypothetical protein